MEDRHALEDMCLHTIDVALEAGKLIRAARRRTLVVSCKKNTTDIVTEVDQAVERLIKDRLEQFKPTYLFIGEESFEGGQSLTEHPTWIVDPIDGTSNFVHGLPDVCVSIGLAINRVPVVGVVYSPFHDELWYASKDNGAFYQTHGSTPRKLSSSELPILDGLRSSCVGVELGSDREGVNFEANISVLLKLARTTATGGKFVNAIRATGSAAIAMCRVASGQQDCFWECGSWAWDVCGAWCVVIEAGGVVTDVHPGNKFIGVDNRRYLVVRPADVEQQESFIDEFWDAVDDDRWTFGP